MPARNCTTVVDARLRYPSGGNSLFFSNNPVFLSACFEAIDVVFC